MMRAASGLARGVVIGVLGVVVVIGVLLLAFARGWLGFDDFVVRRVVASVQHYLVPEIGFRGFSYDAPYGVTLEGVTFTAVDSEGDGAGEPVEVVRAGEARIRLGEAPGVFGGPIVFEEITLVEPEVRLIREETAEGGVGFRGLVPFVKRDRVVEQEAQPEGKKLSEIFELRRLAIESGRVRYEDGSGNPMVFRGIDLDADITEERDEEGTVWHRVRGSFGEAPLVDLDVDARLDLDSLVVALEEVRLSADLTSEAGVNALPPRLQRLLGEREATGRLDARLVGRVAARDPLSSEVSGDVSMEGVKVVSGDLQLPVESFELPFEMSGGVARVPAMVVKMLGGEIRVSDVTADLSSDEMRAQAVWGVEAIDLNRLMRGSASGGGGEGGGDEGGEGDGAGEGGGGGAEVDGGEGADVPDLYGKIASSGVVTMRLDRPRASMDGQGSFELREGQLVVIPVLTRLFRAMDLVGALRGEGSHDDSVTAAFRLRPKGVVFDELTVEVPGAKLTGDGVLGWDRALDMQMRGGAIEAIPVVGEAMGKVTGRLARYDIGGTVSEPTVRVEAGRAIDRTIDEGEEAIDLIDEVLPGDGEAGDEGGGSGPGDRESPGGGGGDPAGGGDGNGGGAEEG